MVVLECHDAERVVEVLAKHGIVVSARGRGLRVSFHYYNLMQDVEAPVDVVDRNQQLFVMSDSR